ncbi:MULTISPECIES: hydantoinase B/oxoprolinase family protein [Halolamina]|uniref:N-methylhydantoinase B n=1 Tax=Halolamina pelagica TaxID=699431 RepID=A0A1I5RS28_9EURY|nr:MULTISPECIES: hydantoinase B/oxoprolinase family protein [Halolamina]NHX35317.1 hydantoinase B/oxoprolinase family protein [Halolamina sp. R1-12]SFP61322.1 N-methylhydantoinase B [Halolamina pelagica]
MSADPAAGDDAEVDPVTLEVVRNGCVAVAEEMNANLVRTGYSPNIKERRDCSCALFGADGEMVSQAENMPVHLGAMPFSVRAAVDAFEGDLNPGDAILLNDPFRGGAHLPDLTLVSPVFADPESDDPRLVAYAANRAHHADIGGSTAGSVAADSTEIYQEGLRIPPVKLIEDGEIDDDVFGMILANVRTPDERRGDVRAQEAANETARERVHGMVDEYGADTLEAAFEAVKDYSERRMRSELEAFPDGTYEFSDLLDDDGRGNEDLPVEVEVTVDGDEVGVDFAGTAPQTEGPINAVLAVTSSATYYAVRCVTDPEIPPNHGCYRPISIDAPERSLVNPEPPAAVVGGNLETSQRVTDVVLGAFATEAPERVLAACQGTMNNVTFGGTDPRGEDGDGADGEPYAFYETQGGGFGGRAGKDGMDGVHVHMSNTMNTPAEVLETAYPLRILRYSLRPDSGGAGEFRGGLGLRRDIEVRDHTARFSLLADRQRHAPYGLEGGDEGERGAAYLYDDADAYDAAADDDAADAGEKLPQKSVHDLPPGSVVSIRTPGAGGYGDPDERAPTAIDRDLRLGKLTPAAALARYGVDEGSSSAGRTQSDDADPADLDGE